MKDDATLKAERTFDIGGERNRKLKLAATETGVSPANLLKRIIDDFFARYDTERAKLFNQMLTEDDNQGYEK